MRKKISLFLILCLIFLAGMGYRFGGDLWVVVKRNLAVKFYSGVLELYMPQVAAVSSQQLTSSQSLPQQTCPQATSRQSFAEGEELTETFHSSEDGNMAISLLSTIYEDLTASLLPVFSYHEELLCYEAQAENDSDYEALAAKENEQMGLLIAENESACVGQSNGETAGAKQSGSGLAGDGSAQGDSGLQGDGVADGSDTQGGSGLAESSGTQGGSGAAGGSGTQGNGTGTAGAGTSQEGTAVTAGASAKKVTVNREKLYDFDYLRQNFYIVDSSTTIGNDQLNAEKLLGKSMTINSEGEGPQILIYHTHSQEGYIDSTAGNADTSVVAVGEYLTQILTQQYGFRVLHHTGEYDVGDRDHAYSNAAPALAEILAANPSIQVVIDLHRDSVGENTHLVTEINGKPTAKIMFFNGLSRTTVSGDLTNLPNPYIEDNLALSFQLQLAAAEYYPDLTRKIYLKGYRYNMHYCPKSILVEVGAQNNTLEEAMNAMEPLADVLSKVLTGTE